MPARNAAAAATSSRVVVTGSRAASVRGLSARVIEKPSADVGEE
jgi:hypothetical protein